jgi:endonuclease YncB( thermonuclease family)
VTTTLLIGLLAATLTAPVAAAEPSDTIGVVDSTTGEWFLRDPASGDTTSFFYGDPGDYPLMGDWDCDGIDTPGLYRQTDGYVYLRNTNTQGVADIRFYFGNPSDIPLAGDFDGDGCDTVSIYRPSEGRVYVINRLGANEGGLGQAEVDYYFGNPGDKPFVGDFNNDGVDTVGLHRETTGFVYFRNSHTSGVADESFFYGDPGDQIITGRWAQNPTPGPDTVGIFRPSQGTFYLRFSNTAGNADVEFQYGGPTMAPVAGDFGALPGGDAPPSGPIIGDPAVVTNVVDGDTIDVDLNGTIQRVRFIGVDTPEVGDCLADQATARTTALTLGKAVTLVKDTSEVDRFGRLLRYVYVGTEHVGETLVREGLAYAVRYPPDTAKAAELDAAQALAKGEGLGVWGSGGCLPPPGPACDPSYPTVCIPPPPPDLDCGDIPFRRFTVLPPDPHRFDGDGDGIGCESG